jgi:hypothetical protein
MNKEKLESAKNLFFIALGIDIVVTALVMISTFWGIGVIKDIRAGRITADQSTISTLEFWDSFAKLMLLTMLGVGLGLVKWLNACYGYAKESIGASGFKNDGWTLGAWIIPFLNFFKPYQVINEIYKAGSTTYVIPDEWKKESGSGLLLTWWIFWVLLHLLGAIFFRSVSGADMVSIGAVGIHTWFYGLSLIVSGLWLVVAGRLTHRLLGRQLADGNSLLPRQPERVVTQMATLQHVIHPIQASSPSSALNQSFSKPTLSTSDHAGTNAHSSTANAQSADVMTLDNVTEEDHWATAMAEVESGQRRPGVWGKAFAESDGDETKAKVVYLKARVQQLTDAVRALKAKEEAEKQEEILKAQAAVRADEESLEQSIRQFLTSGTISLGQIRRLIQHSDKARIVNLADTVRGNTLLHICAESDMLEEVNALLISGAESQISNNKGLRPEFMTTSWTTRLLITGTTISVDQLKRAVEFGVNKDGDKFSVGDHNFPSLQEALNFAIAASKAPQAELRNAVLAGFF